MGKANMSVLRFLGASAIAAAIGIPSLARAADYIPSADSLTLTPSASTVAQDSNAPQQTGATSDQLNDPRQPNYLDAAPDAPNIHGFAEIPFKTAYVTPRGLVVENQGLVIQPVVGLVMPLDDIGPIGKVALVTGVWNSINLNQHDPYVGPWNELDYFLSISGSVDKFTGTLTYSPWYSPPHAFHIESTSDFKVGYDDTGMIMKGFAFKPYVDFFYSISGDSTVILGRHGSTYYFEFGMAPSYTWKASADYPLTFSFPTYFSVGPKNYWDITESHSNFGVFSTAFNVTVPLAFIPIRYGAWHADCGLQYFYLMNGALLQAGDIASGNNNRNVLNASVGIGFNF
jgi:hypothetical protein